MEVAAAAATSQPQPTTIPRWFQEQVLRLKEENVRNINLNLRRVSTEMLEALAEALQGNSSIQVINLTSCLTTAALLQRNNGHDAMLLPLARAVEQNSSLTTLHLSYNRLVHAPSLARCISSSSCCCCSTRQSSLVELRLDHNQLNDETVIALAETLATNTTLKVLHLDSNNIGDNGGVAIAKSLWQNETLQKLGLGRNNLGTVTVKALLEVLQTKNVSLNWLSLPFYKLDMDKRLSQRCLFLVKANRFGRYLLQSEGRRRKTMESDCNSAADEESRLQNVRQDNTSNNIRNSLWPLLLARAEPDVTFFFLVEKPSLVPSCHS